MTEKVIFFRVRTPYRSCYTGYMQFTSFTRYVVRLEYLFAAVLIALFFVTIGGFDWWWLILLFPLFDLSMVGYLVNSHVGAITYNIVHSYVGPVILTFVYILTTPDITSTHSADSILLFAVLLWLFHITVDRALGFGLKHEEGFHHTHLGKIGKAKKK